MPTQVELSTLAESITNNHDHVLVQISIFKYLTTTLLNRYADLYKINLSAQLDLANLCVNAYLKQIGISPDEMQYALSTVVRAAKTSEYLASLPK